MVCISIGILCLHGDCHLCLVEVLDIASAVPRHAAMVLQNRHVATTTATRGDGVAAATAHADVVLSAVVGLCAYSFGHPLAVAGIVSVSYASEPVGGIPHDQSGAHAFWRRAVELLDGASRLVD